jgi:GLPGLI family protein
MTKPKGHFNCFIKNIFFTFKITRMKTLINFISLFFISVSILAAQGPSEGSIRYIATHSWVKQINKLSFFSKQQKEKMRYVYGKNDTWRVVYDLHFTDKQSRYIKAEEQVEDNEFWSGRKEVYDINRDFATAKTFDLIETMNKTYLIEDSIPTYNWKIKNELKEVSGYICMKANVIDPVHGHSITAWFSQELLVPAGPERYSGLPGLILELDYNDGALVITAQSVKIKTLEPNLLKLPKVKKAKKISEKEYQKLVKTYIDDSIAAERNPYWSIRY